MDNIAIGQFNYEFIATCDKCHDMITVELIILNKHVTAERIWLKHVCGGNLRVVEAHEATVDGTMVSTMQNGRGKYVRG